MPSKARVLSQSKALAYIRDRQTRSIKLHNFRKRLRLAIQELPVLGQVNHELRLLRCVRLHSGVAGAKDLFKELSSKGISSREILSVLKGSQPPYESVFLHHCRWALSAEQYYDAQEQSRQADFVKGELKRLKNPIVEVLKCPLLPQAMRDSLKGEITEIESELDAFRSYLAENTPTIPHPFTVTPYDPNEEDSFKRRHKGSDWSRQGFWTPVIVALCSIWKKAGQTDYQAFKDIARLFALMFHPFPDKPELVKRRFYHASRPTIVER